MPQLAAAWLIRRFVNPYAALLHVEAAQVTAVAEELGVQPLPGFDALTARLTAGGVVRTGLARFLPPDAARETLRRMLEASYDCLGSGCRALEAALTMLDAHWAAERTEARSERA